MALSTRCSHPARHTDVTRVRRPARVGQALFDGGSSDVAPDPDSGDATSPILRHFQELKARRRGRAPPDLLRHQSTRRRRPNRRAAHCRSNAERPVMPSGAWLRTVFPAECDLGLEAARHNRTRWRERRRMHHRRSDERRRPDRAAPSSGLVAVAALHHGRLRAAHNCRVSGAVAAIDRATYLETGEVAPVNGGDYAEWTACRCRATQREPWCATPRLGITGCPA